MYGYPEYDVCVCHWYILVDMIGIFSDDDDDDDDEDDDDGMMMMMMMMMPMTLTKKG